MARDIQAERKQIDEAVAGQTVLTLLDTAVAEHPDIEAMRWKQADDTWTGMTWREYGALAADLANGLISIGVKPGEFVNILCGNRYEYNALDVAIMQAGGVPVSLYNTLAPEQIEYIVNHCEAAFAIVENKAFYERLLKVKGEIPNVRKVVMLDGAEEFADDDWVISYDEVLSAGREFGKANPKEREQRIAAVKPEDLCTLIYTSGTTGPPKGVMVSHYNVCWTAESAERVYKRRPGLRHISYLPMAHIAERMLGHYLHLRGATTVSFCPNPTEIAQYLPAVKPQFFFAVPRVWEKMHSGLLAALGGMPDEQREGAEKALATGLARVRAEQAGKPVPKEVQDKLEEAELVASFVRATVGLDECELAGTGAAPIANENLEFFHALGINVAEVYGQSEDTGPTSWNPPEKVKIGTVGPTLPGVEIKLEDDGELLVRGGNVTSGYYKEPELTAETFVDGWLRSGDIAQLDDDGYITIVDRKKEILITAGGKNIAPSNMENLLKQHNLIGQACVVGDRKPYVTALITLDSETAIPWAKSKGLPENVAELSRTDEVRAEIQSFIDEMNTKLHNQEQVKKFVVLSNEWTVDSEELTPTLKMKRKVVNEKYASEIEAMYSS